MFNLQNIQFLNKLLKNNTLTYILYISNDKIVEIFYV